MMIRPQAFGFDGTHNFDGSLISEVGERKRGPLDMNITSPGSSNNNFLGGMARDMRARPRRGFFNQGGIGSFPNPFGNRGGFGNPYGGSRGGFFGQPPQFGGGMYGNPYSNPFGPRPPLMYGGGFSGPPMFGGGYMGMPPMFGGGSPCIPELGGHS
jgi:hypothetical protein